MKNTTQTKTACCCRGNGSERGFWLVGLALAIAVVGVSLAGYMQIETARQLREDAEKTTDHMNEVAKAIDSYVARMGVLPCPASMNATLAESDFGKATDCTVTTIPVGSCSGGICIQKSQRTEGMRVRIGAVPVKLLNLPTETAMDAWGNLITLAVTEPMAQSVAAGAAGGGISVVDAVGTSVVSPANTARYVVVSSGPDGGSRAGCPDTGLDAENCFNGYMATVPTSAIFRQANYQTASGANHFDDRIIYRTSEVVQCSAGTVVWTESGVTCSGTVPQSMHNATAPTTNVLAGVTGNATFKCNAGTFDYVSGTCSALTCPATTVNWLGNCSAVLPSKGHGDTASAVNTAANYTGTGNFLCNGGTWTYQSGNCDVIPPSGCTATTKSWSVGSATCAGPVAAAAHGESRTASNTSAGTTGSASYTCNNGTFNYVTGSCVQGCSGGTKTWLTNCSGVLGDGTDGQTAATTNVASGYTGTANFTCSGGNWTYSSGTCTGEGECSVFLGAADPETFAVGSISRTFEDTEISPKTYLTACTAKAGYTCGVNSRSVVAGKGMTTYKCAPSTGGCDLDISTWSGGMETASQNVSMNVGDTYNVVSMGPATCPIYKTATCTPLSSSVQCTSVAAGSGCTASRTYTCKNKPFGGFCTVWHGPITEVADGPLPIGGGSSTHKDDGYYSCTATGVASCARVDVDATHIKYLCLDTLGGCKIVTETSPPYGQVVQCNPGP